MWRGSMEPGAGDCALSSATSTSVILIIEPRTPSSDVLPQPFAGNMGVGGVIAMKCCALAIYALKTSIYPHSCDSMCSH